MNIGSDGGDRSSVKVHHAPGGHSSLNIFGGGEYQEPVVSHSKASYGYTPPVAPFSRAPLKESVPNYGPSHTDSYAPSYGSYAPAPSRVQDSYGPSTFSMGPSFAPTHASKSRDYEPPSGYGQFSGSSAPSFPSSYSYEGHK
jgi:hypothetical protein